MMVDTSKHDMNALFQQLGLASQSEAIEQFIESHKPLANHIPLPEASFWNAGQAEFLREVLEEDSDWTELVDELDARLRS